MTSPRAQPPPASDPRDPANPTSRLGTIERTAVTIALNVILAVVVALLRWLLVSIVLLVCLLAAISALFAAGQLAQARPVAAAAAALLLALAWWQWRIWSRLRALAGKYPFRLWGWHWFTFLAPFAAALLAVALLALQTVAGDVGLLAPLVILSAAPWWLRRRAA